LITNAIKFSPVDGDIQILSQLNETEEKTTLTFSVFDNGIGISMEDQKSLFQPFFRVKSTQSQSLNPNGNGLGLSICKSISKCLNGDITAISEKGKGSIFNCTVNVPDIKNLSNNTAFTESLVPAS